MPHEIILLTGELEACHLAPILNAHAPNVSVIGVTSGQELCAACDPPAPGRRLIGFCTDVIVPATVLNSLAGPAYNFHPGPPEYPGSQVAFFAVYEGAAEFGVTVHEMAPTVDSGTIVAVKRFPVPLAGKFMDLEVLAYNAMLALFNELALHFATDDAPLPASGDAWSGPVRTKAMADAYRVIEADMEEEEIAKRYRAFG
ncbi:MAG: formyltransferase family protein [Proteobacteria bacterium]|nr:formyltransferase family protein [Pseudomonadota bacterium]